MITYLDDLPTNPVERAIALQELLVSHATGVKEDEAFYRELRAGFIDQVDTRELLPAFVRSHRTLSAFWSWIKGQSGQYEPRRQIIRSAFTPLLDHLEGGSRSPADKQIAQALETFDEAGVHKAWEKALARRSTDPEGAITAARAFKQRHHRSIE
jgi:hypothetical protein